MPDQTWDREVDRLEEAVQHIDTLAAAARAEVAELTKKRHRDRIIFLILVAVVVALALLFVYTLDRFDDQREVAEEQVEAARQQACRNRNDAARVFRLALEGQFIVFEQSSRGRELTAQQTESLEALRAAVPRQAETELDCNRDGEVSEADYSPPPP